MSRFIVRVVLHGVKEDDDAYDELHEQMEKRFFYRWIADKDGVKWKLPPATYRVRTTGWRLAGIRGEVLGITATIRFPRSVFVTRYYGATWVGLERL